MNKGFHINLTISLNNVVLGQIELKTKELSDLGNHTPTEMSSVAARETLPK